MKSKNWFWGIFFILAAIAVIAIQTGSFAEIGIQSLLLGAFLLAIIIASLVRFSAFGIFFPIAFLYMIFWQPLNLMYVNYWYVLLAALLVSIGFEIIFGKHNKYKHTHNHDYSCDRSATESIDDNNPDIAIKFGSACKYLHSDNFQGGKFTLSFGELQVFFDQVKLKSEGTEIFVDCSFGSLVLNVPRDWKVKENVHVSMGGFDNKVHNTNLADDAPTLMISGNLWIGSIEVKYI
jgi:predicted membrane protein